MMIQPCKLRFWGLWTLIVLIGALAGASNTQASSKAYQWLSYYQGGSNASFAQVSAFIKNNPDWPAQRRLRVEAEDKISAVISDAQIISWFSSHEPITYKAANRYINALKSAGRHDEVKKAARTWWAEANISRDQQRDFYAAHQSLLNRAAHIKRLNHLLYKGSYQNALGVADVLGGGYPALAKARLALLQGKSNVDGLVAAVPNSLKSDTGLQYERLRWRRKNDYNAGAIQILNSAPPVKAMHDPAKWWRERHIIVRRLIEERKYRDAYRMASAHKQKEKFPQLQAEWVSGWLAFTYINEPWKGFEHFEKLYHAAETPISKARGAYWAGRASEVLKRPDVAKEWYRQAAKYNEVFYGQLAKDALGQTPDFKKAPRRMTPSKSYNSQEMAVAARALFRQGYKKEASLFLTALRNEAKSANDLRANAALSHSMGLEVQAIKATQAAQKQFDTLYVGESYPLLVKDVQGIRDVEWALIHAIIRQESRFDKNAVSHAGARGLMQVMPATAKSVARKIGTPHRTDWLTSRPSHNIQLGSRYIREMVERYNGSYALAIAAYNAGPGRVDRWLTEFGDPRTGQIDLIQWIERIPIYETRNYVQRVMEAIYVYRGLLKNIQSPPTKDIHIAMN